MTNRIFQALVKCLAAKVGPLRREREGSARLLPDDKHLVRDLRRVRRDVGVVDGCRVSGDEFWIMVGLLLYGPTFDPGDAHRPSPSRFAHARDYVEQWRYLQTPAGRTNVFRDEHVLELSFVYALGAERPAGAAGSETRAQALAWGSPNWGTPVLVLERYLKQEATKLLHHLPRLGCTAPALMPDRRPVGHLLYRHTLDVLLGVRDETDPDWPYTCKCGPLFREDHPGEKLADLLRRHKDSHTFGGYLRKHSWPDGRRSKKRDYAKRPYTVREFVFRAACGDHPAHHTFEYGLWFHLIESNGDSLKVIKTPVCPRCARPIPTFDGCPRCGQPIRKQTLSYRVVQKSDTDYQLVEAKTCRGCGAMIPVDQPTCPCGSAGRGFEWVAKGQWVCRVCDRPQTEGQKAVCAGCGNSSFTPGEPTKFYLRCPAEHLDPDPAPGDDTELATGDDFPADEPPDDDADEDAADGPRPGGGDDAWDRDPDDEFPSAGRTFGRRVAGTDADGHGTPGSDPSRKE